MSTSGASESGQENKGAALLAFLRESATLRRKRISAYGPSDKILWFGDVPRDRPECRSPFLADKPEELTGLWMEVRKKRMPARPPVPQIVADWVRADALDQPDQEPELLREITVIVERQVPDPAAPHDTKRVLVEAVPELRQLANYPEVQDAWLEDATRRKDLQGHAMVGGSSPSKVGSSRLVAPLGAPPLPEASLRSEVRSSDESAEIRQRGGVR